ncbi:hypothetical protein [Craterilacuibacter sinensis]|uniref:Uncharacterized protein n=1 Tax=Craterilacuibacter sinensis TaxID=2686017 RepID=A0A845BZ80_9NEIS|nr:hypothetical protein [Craterilacuibacter sinensis]MXR37813.1 hypothetical protein [Craterilacuibacter sinensis]
MMTTVDAHTLMVLALGMDVRKLAILRMAFRMHKAIRYQLSESAHDVPVLAIVDVDSPQGWAVWDGFRAAHPALPALIVSSFAITDAPAPVLPKPIRVETLFPALQQLLVDKPVVAERSPLVAAQAEVALAEAPRVAVISHAIAEPVSSGTAVPALEMTAAMPASDCDGQQDDPVIPVAQKADAVPQVLPRAVAVWPQAMGSFDPNAGLYGVLRTLYRKRRSAAVLAHGKVVLHFYPAQEKCELLADLALLVQLCAAPKSELRLAVLPDGQESARPDAPSAHAVLWQVALWTARGRMPRGLDGNSQLRLRHWPNLTRLAAIPDAMRMAAFWTRTPASACMAQRMLGLQASDLCNFIAACLAIDLLDARLSAAACSPPPMVQPLPDVARRGLLSRLLVRLRGA